MKLNNIQDINHPHTIYIENNIMIPRNVLTETNNMRKLMGLPLLKEEGGQTIDDIKKKVLNESTIEYEDDQWLVIDKEEDKEEDKDEVNENAPAFSLGFGNQGGLTISEESEHDCKKTHPDQSHPEWEESNLEETTQAKEFEEVGVDENGDDIIEEYDGDAIKSWTATWPSPISNIPDKAGIEIWHSDGEIISA